MNQTEIEIAKVADAMGWALNGDNDEDRSLKKFVTLTYMPAGRKDSFDTLEEAEEHNVKQMRKYPFSNTEYYVVEIRRVQKVVPDQGVKIQSLNADEYYKQLENKEDEL